MADLEGQTAVVTGAAQGIGRAIAAALLERGASVALCDVRMEKLESFAGEMRASTPCAPAIGQIADCEGDVLRAGFITAETMNVNGGTLRD